MINFSLVPKTTSVDKLEVSGRDKLLFSYKDSIKESDLSKFKYWGALCSLKTVLQSFMHEFLLGRLGGRKI